MDLIELRAKAVELEDNEPILGLSPNFAAAIDLEIFDQDDLDWALDTGSRSHRKTDGAIFQKLAGKGWLISVRGSQPWHHDRHILDMDHEGDGGTWNVVLEGDDQLLIATTPDGFIEHFPLHAGQMIYFNTLNGHGVTRGTPGANTILIQVTGFGPKQKDMAIAAMKSSISMRQTLTL